MSSTELLGAEGCSQFVRHYNLFILPQWLEHWGIPYHVVDQQAQEIVITFPGTYHEGFSIGQGVAEACNHAAQGWNLDKHLGCPKTCGKTAITAKAKQLDSSTAQVKLLTEIKTRLLFIIYMLLNPIYFLFMYTEVIRLVDGTKSDLFDGIFHKISIML